MQWHEADPALAILVAERHPSGLQDPVLALVPKQRTELRIVCDQPGQLLGAWALQAGIAIEGTPDDAPDDLDKGVANTDIVGIYMNSFKATRRLDKEEELTIGLAVRAGAEAEARLLEDAALTPAEQAALDGLVAQGWQAQQELVSNNVKLAFSIAQKYVLHGRLELADLIQHANLGLVRAAKEYDPYKTEEPISFARFASKLIHFAIKDGMQQDARTIALPEQIVEALTKLGRVRHKLTASLGEAPTHEQLAEAMKMKPEKLTELIIAGYDTVSFNWSRTPDGRSPEDLQEQARSSSRPALTQSELAEILSVLAQLKDPTDRGLYLGLLGLDLEREGAWGIAEVEEHYQCDREQARRMISNLIDKVKSAKRRLEKERAQESAYARSA